MFCFGLGADEMRGYICVCVVWSTGFRLSFVFLVCSSIDSATFFFSRTHKTFCLHADLTLLVFFFVNFFILNVQIIRPLFISSSPHGICVNVSVTSTRFMFCV